MNEQIKNIRGLIERDRLLEAIKGLQNFIQDKSELRKFRTPVSNFFARKNKLDNEKAQGAVPRSEITVDENKLRIDILKTIDAIENELSLHPIDSKEALSSVRSAFLIAQTEDELRKVLYRVEAFLANHPKHVEARVLKDQLNQALKNTKDLNLFKLDSIKASFQQTSSLATLRKENQHIGILLTILQSEFDLDEKIQTEAISLKQDIRKAIKRKKNQKLIYFIAPLLLVLGMATIFFILRSNQKGNNYAFGSPETYNVLLLPADKALGEEFQENLYYRLSSINTAHKLGLNFKILTQKEVGEEFIMDSKASSIGKSHKADIVIWGNYIQDSKQDSGSLNVRYFSLSESGQAFIKRQGETGFKAVNTLSPLRSGEFTGDIEDIIFWIAGYQKYEEKDYEAAIDLFKKIDPRLDKPEYSIIFRAIGDAYLNLKQYSAAEENYNQALRMRPDDGSVYNNRGILYKEQHDMQRALDDYSQAITFLKDQPGPFINRGALYQERKDYEKAENDYKQALGLDEKNIAANVNLGVLFSETGRTEEAYEKYEIAIANDPDDATAYVNMGVYHHKKGELDKAAEYYFDALERDSSISAAHNNLANILFILGDLEKAEKSYSKAIQYDSSEYLSFLSRARIRNQIGQYDKAIIDLNMAIVLAPDTPAIYIERASVYKEMGNDVLATADFEKAKELGGGNFYVLITQAGMLSEQKRYEEALDLLNQAISLAPKEKTGWMNRAFVYAKLDYVRNAIDDYGKVLEIDHEDSDVYKNRGNLYQKTGDFDRAIADYSKALDLRPEDINILFNRAGAYEQGDDLEKAIEDYKSIIRLDPRNKIALQNRAYYFHQKEKYSQAIMDYTNILVENPKDTLIYLYRGQSYQSLEKYDSAHLDYSEAINLDPHHAQAWSQRGYVNMYLKRMTEAKADYDRALELDPNLAEAYFNRGIFFYNEQKDIQSAIEDIEKAIDLKPNNNQFKETLNQIRRRIEVSTQ